MSDSKSAESMSSEIPPVSAESIKVERLDPQSRQINLTVKVVSKSPVRETISRSDGSAHRVADALVGDETGAIYLTLWDDNIDKVNEGDVISIKNGYVSLFKGSMRLNIGRFGTFERADVPLPEVNTKNNLSEKRFEQERRYPTFRPAYRDEGYRRGRRFRGPRRRY